MRLTAAQLERAAARAGFRAEPLEKALHLLELLDALRSHPFLKDRLVLKGGTALNLFLSDLPRLSVDVDLNYVGAADRETMLAERPRVEQAVEAVCGRLGLEVRRAPREHAGGKWRLSYVRADGGSGALELDLNFLLRTPLWAAEAKDSLPLASFRATGVPVLDLHELAGGKLAALFGRQACRDAFDVRELLLRGGLDRARLRLASVLYGAMSRRDWRTVSVEDVSVDAKDVDRQLLPLLRSDLVPARSAAVAWSERLQAECRGLLSSVLPLESREIEFVGLVNDRGEIVPELLTDDEQQRNLIRSHPGLLWKTLNVRQHRGLGQAPSAGGEGG